VFTLALISGEVVLTGYMEWKFTGDPRTIGEIIGLGAVGVLAFIATVVSSSSCRESDPGSASRGRMAQSPAGCNG
jgi:hypothetical protein